MIRTNLKLLPEWTINPKATNAWDRVQRTGFTSPNEVLRAIKQALGKRKWELNTFSPYNSDFIDWKFDSQENEDIAKPILLKAFGEYEGY